MALRRNSSFHLLFLCILLAAAITASDAGAAGPPQQQYPQAHDCSTAGNYNITDAYAINLNHFLDTLPNNTVSKNGGFFNGTVGEGNATVYGLALCSADFSRSDCYDCLTSNASALFAICSGSVTVSAIFDQCMVRYSNTNFFGTAQTEIKVTSTGGSLTSNVAYINNLKQGLDNLSAQAATSPERFATSTTPPYALVQCTWDLPSDQCQSCINTLTANATTDLSQQETNQNQNQNQVQNDAGVKTDGERKSYSCRVRYSSSSFAVVPLVPPPPPSPLSPSPPSSSSLSPSPSRGTPSSVVAGAVTGAIVLVAGTLAAVFFCVRRKNRPIHRLGHQILPKPPQDQRRDKRRFSYRQLSSATDNFSASRKLGSGSFGDVYKGELQNLGFVAVKMIYRVNENTRSAYNEEIKAMRQLDHPNLVYFIGWCDERDKLLLVYELVGNRSLDYHLHSAPGILDWQKRYKIAVGIAKALVYMHGESVVHRDIKPSNVMLDEQYNAKVCDFGLVRGVDPQRTSQTMTPIGALSYMDPEYQSTGKASTASDIYSFGVTLLEIASGEIPTRSSNNSISLTEKVRAALSGKNQLRTSVMVRRLNGVVDIEQMERVLRVGLLCMEFDHHDRPNSKQVLSYLTGEATIPLQPNTPNTRTSSVTILQDTRLNTFVPREFQHHELQVATDGFSEVLGQGSYGIVYKGKLQDDNLGITWEVAIKKSKTINAQATLEYRREIQLISQLRHRNLLRLMGWCQGDGELLLVYEFMSMGCLSDILSTSKDTTSVNQGRGEPLDWTKRYNIIVGLASALHYLHFDSPFDKKSILHRDIKPSNVMLNDAYEAKLGDFGLMRPVDLDRPSQTVTRGGTHAYIDPEYYKTGNPSRESDVYSFGILMLQLVFGELPTITINDGKKLTNQLAEKAWDFFFRNKLLDAVDAKLKVDGSTFTRNKAQIERVMLVGLHCVHPDRSKRPSSSRVMAYLKDREIQIPAPARVTAAGAPSDTTGNNNNGQAIRSSSAAAHPVTRQHSDQYSTCQG